MMKAKQISELHEAQENVYHENKKGFFSIRSKCLKQTKQNVKHTILTLILERSHNENISKPQFFYTAAKYTLKVTLKYSKVKKNINTLKTLLIVILYHFPTFEKFFQEEPLY